MNKTITAMLVAVVLFAGAHVTFAATQCGDNSLNNASSTVIYIACGNGSPESVIGGWGTTNAGVPHMSQGQVATDANGIHSTCQWMNGCVNVYGTPWYAGLISALKASISPEAFQHWINLQK